MTSSERGLGDVENCRGDRLLVLLDELKGRDQPLADTHAPLAFV